ncbi:MAG: arginine--tRNA ligase [Minisyncoccia bacterium]
MPFFTIGMKETILKQIENWLKETLGESGVVSFNENLNNGDVSTNIALSKENPKKSAEEFLEKLISNKPDFIGDITIAGPGFINFSLSESFLLNAKSFLFDISNKNEKVIIEYTDPNPFKEFHIGHLMSNSIGEAIAGLIEATGADVKRACYQGDVGMHVAKALWKGDYAVGSKAYEEDESAKAEIQEINKKIYNGSDLEINSKYEEGKKKSLEAFEKMYKKLGTNFSYFFFESQSGPKGLQLVKENTPKVFVESDGAVVYKGEERDKKLHTRVFINKEGLPTYEAKELGLLQLKKEKEPSIDKSIVITGNEINEYFKVVMSAGKEIDVIKDLAEKTHHISHGMMRLPSGKMSSRTGDVITAESLINTVRDEAQKIIDKSDRGTEEGLAEKIAIGALKFSILRQHPGKDIIFDINKSVSFEGDSGPYIMYTHARANSLLEKGKDAGIEPVKTKELFGAKSLMRLLVRFDDVVERGAKEFSPNILVEYLLEITSAFNSWYAQEQMITDDKNISSQKLFIVKTFKDALARGLEILAISAPSKM